MKSRTIAVAELPRPLLRLRIRASFVAFVVVSAPNLVNAGVFGPATYEDCILENMKGVTSNLAAAEIRQACRAKFPKKCSEIKDLTEQTVAKIGRECEE